MSQSSSSSGGKTNYNKHFPRSLPLNYGAALQDPKEESILSRLHDFNCEWLQRPNVAISEMAQTLRENIALIRQYSGTIFRPEFVEDFLGPLESLSASFSRLDNKDKSTAEPPSREDVVSVLRAIDQDENLNDAIIEGFNAAGPLLMMCVHLLVPQTLMRHPEEFAQKMRRTPATQPFKENPSCHKMKDFILDSITKRWRPVPRNVSIWDQDDDDDDQSTPDTSSRRRARQHAPVQRRPPPTTWDDSSGFEDSQSTTSGSSSQATNSACTPATPQARQRVRYRQPVDSQQQQSSSGSSSIPNSASTPRTHSKYRQPASSQQSQSSASPVPPVEDDDTQPEVYTQRPATAA